MSETAGSHERVADGPFQGLRRNGYGLIMADPPWRFLTYSEKGLGKSPQSHYDCMDLEGIMSLPVQDLAAKDCLLLLWGLDTMVPQALAVIAAWGFTYKTIGFNWAKLNKNWEGPAIEERDFFMGTGYWTRGNSEICWLATKGHPKRIAKNVRRLVPERRREHSRKPEKAYAGAERLVAGPYLELFSRTSRKNWDCWGNEAGTWDGADAA